MSGQGQESTILVPAKDPEQKKSESEKEEQKPNGDVNKGKGKDEGTEEPDIVREKSLSWWCPREGKSGVGSRESPGVL
jgi:hypothetical protein